MNDYDKDELNGDVGIVEPIDTVEQQVMVRFDERLLSTLLGNWTRFRWYAVTIHKAQGSEFPTVVIPLATQHYMLLQRNLIYTGIHAEAGYLDSGEPERIPWKRISDLFLSPRSEGDMRNPSLTPDERKRWQDVYDQNKKWLKFTKSGNLLPNWSELGIADLADKAIR